MTPHIEIDTQPKTQLSGSEWIKLGLVTAFVSIAVVLAVQALAIALWPEIALFAPLDSYVRSALFTSIPVIGATFLLAWLVGRQERAPQRFITISVIVLLVSIIPDYMLPVPNKTVLASSVAAFLHVVAALIIVVMLLTGYQRSAR
ncbi:MAG: hypothetical protein DCC55_15225 [Chloroflexi bacterium]|nr:MAG: hypothetical protein DCC55_15225 [Chloroflexota bacterium]